MEQKKPMTTMQKGIILSLIIITLSVLMSVFIKDMQQQQKYAWASYIIILGGIIWACYTYAQDMENNVTFGNVFAHGFKVSAVLASFTVIYTILSITVLFPEVKEQALELTRSEMEKQGVLGDAEIDQSVSMISKFFLPFAIAGAALGTLIIGVISALIGAAVVKKNPNPTPFQTNEL
jgi:hypothetical protein